LGKLSGRRWLNPASLAGTMMQAWSFQLPIYTTPPFLLSRCLKGGNNSNVMLVNYIETLLAVRHLDG
jgi:hypothetical protein